MSTKIIQITAFIEDEALHPYEDLVDRDDTGRVYGILDHGDWEEPPEDVLEDSDYIITFTEIGPLGIPKSDCTNVIIEEVELEENKQPQ